MRAFGQRTWLIIGAAGLTLSSASPSNANVFQDLWEIVTDPLKLGKSSDKLSATVQDALVQLQAMEATGNHHAEERLEQIRSILRGAFEGGQETIDRAEADMLALEKKIDQDAVDFVYRAQCAVQQTLDQGHNSFAEYASDLRQVNPGIFIFGIEVVDIRTHDIKVTEPDRAYRTIKAEKLRQLDKAVTENTPAADIVSVYRILR